MFKPKKNTMLQKALKDPNLESKIQEENQRGAKYIIENGFRKVPPYYYTYLTFCKQRWINKTLFEVFSTEFRDRPQEYYKKAIDGGMVLVNNMKANLKTTLKGGDLIIHRTHKHEPAITAKQIRIVHVDDELVVIDKPAGIPVHATGRFRFNSVVSLLSVEHDIECHPCNRLDRLTSGLMFLSKTPKGADKMSKQIREREVSKEYLALCVGDIGTEQIIVDLPIRTVSPKVTLNMVDIKDGRPSKTIFKQINFNKEKNIALVLCKPLSGRTHQIRVHLQHIGHPIANDPIYSSPYIWGNTHGKGACVGNTDILSIIDKLDGIGKNRSASSYFFPNSDGEVLSGEKCNACGTELYTDPGPNDLDLWLHALRYRSMENEWEYQTELPDFAVDLHLKYMKLALDEAKKAPDLPGAFAVGAVLVHNDEVLATGYTRELEGNTHAEQNALEKLKKQGRELPLGTCLYTTMEPCTLRLSGNIPCCERVLENKNITTVFVGVTEPDDFVKNNSSRRKLEEGGVIYLQIPGVSKEALEIAKKGHEKVASIISPI